MDGAKSIRLNWRRLFDRVIRLCVFVCERECVPLCVSGRLVDGIATMSFNGSRILGPPIYFFDLSACVWACVMRRRIALH